MEGPAKPAYVSAMRNVRRLLDEAGSGREVSSESLSGCRADILVVQQRVQELRASELPYAHFFEISPELDALFARIAEEEIQLRAARQEQPLSERV